MVYAVYTTESFEKEIKKLPDSDKSIIQNIFLQLKENPYVGDQIRYRFFREKRIREKRVYYLVYDDLSAVLVVAFGGKKAQQETIDRIIAILPEFKIYLEKLLKSKKPTGF
jgi:mRNA-degrading endonuclease RelE of RelBE toxin-antitoxin system